MKSKNEFRTQVDSMMKNVQWTPWKSAAVYRRLHEEKRPKCKRYLAIVMAAVLVMAMTITAVAVNALKRTPEADAITQARRMLMEKYGLTHETIGAFSNVCTENENGWTVTFESSMGLSPKRLGVYTVEKAGDTVTVSWTHDGVNPAEWNNGDLLAPAWGQPQLVKALDAEREAAYKISVGECEGPIETPLPADMAGASVWNTTTREVEPVEVDMTKENAIEIAQVALMDEFGLTAEEAAVPFSVEDYAYHAGQLVVDGDGTRMWELAFHMILNGTEYNGAVFINSQTGEVEAVEYTTLGNG